MAWIILYYTLEAFKWLIIIRAVMSWFVSPHSQNPAFDLLRRATDPILRPIREMIPLAGGIDLSPIVAFFAIVILQQVIARIA
jgi:YggT family protein